MFPNFPSNSLLGSVLLMPKMLASSASASARAVFRSCPNAIKRDPFLWLYCVTQNIFDHSVPSTTCFTHSPSEASCTSSALDSLSVRRSNVFTSYSILQNCLPAAARCMSCTSFEVKTDNDVVRFSIGKPLDKTGPSNNGNKKMKVTRRVKMSKKAKLNELRFYRLKAKKKMNSPNPQVRIIYKLEKAKRKEAWLIEKLRKFEVPKAPAETHDPEILTEEEKHYLKRTGEKKKNYVPVGRRGVFGGVVLNMHLHWKKHETVKVICRPCKPGQVHEYAEELARLSKGIVIDIKPNNSIIFYRGKNYVQPKIMSPLDTLSKNKALEKYKYEQSLEHTSQFIEKLENELEEYQKHVARFKKANEDATQESLAKT